MRKRLCGFNNQRHAYKLMRHAMVTRKIKYGLFCELEMKKMSGIRSMIYLSIYYSSLWMLQEEQCFTTKILLTSNKLRILLSCILWILELKESGIIVPCMYKYCVTFCVFILFMKYHSSGWLLQVNDMYCKIIYCLITIIYH